MSETTAVCPNRPLPRRWLLAGIVLIVAVVLTAAQRGWSFQPERETPPPPPADAGQPGLQNQPRRFRDTTLSEPPEAPDSLAESDVNPQIVILGYKGIKFQYNLIGAERTHVMTLEPNRAFGFTNNQPWVIEFHRGGPHGMQRYRLRSAVYRFLPTDRGFDLHRVADLERQAERVFEDPPTRPPT